MNDRIQVNIIGAGLAGLSAAITLAEKNIPSRLISVLPSERAQSVLAEGGINGALNTMGEDDAPEMHFEDTMKAGVYIADETAVRGLTESAPDILRKLKVIGVPFNLKNEQIQLRNFGGQKKKRTAYARSSTGKVLMSALIDEARKYEVRGLITRYSHHEMADLLISQSCKRCYGVVVTDTYSHEITEFEGPVILAYGGMNGMFPGETTGTVTNSGNAAALCFSRGIVFSNLEMIQYHPTTIKISGKRCLVSEAARGEGGRLFVIRNGQPWGFMEELHPEMGNLSPRDVVAREMYCVSRNFTSMDLKNARHSVPEGFSSEKAGEEVKQIWLDMRHLPKETWERKLPDLRKEIRHYLGIDPAKDPVPVEPGIHYFMGGINVDVNHRTNVQGLYAAGECCSQYHGANRLGGNSTMGAIYGGQVAAKDIAGRWNTEEFFAEALPQDAVADLSELTPGTAFNSALAGDICRILLDSLGIIRNESQMQKALKELDIIEEQAERKRSGQSGASCGSIDISRIRLAKAMLMSALYRKESRGAHFRSDHPVSDDEYRGATVCRVNPEGKPECIMKQR